MTGGGVDELGPMHRGALRLYAALPERLRTAVVHAIAPAHYVGALCFLEHDGRVLLLRQRHRQGWTLPGGLIDRGESAQAAVEREVREETGLLIAVGTPLTTVVDPDRRRVDVIFHVPLPEPVPVSPRSEATAARWLTRDQAGPLDRSTAMAFAAFEAARRPGDDVGRLVGPA